LFLGDLCIIAGFMSERLKLGRGMPRPECPTVCKGCNYEEMGVMEITNCPKLYEVPILEVDNVPCKQLKFLRASGGRYVRSRKPDDNGRNGDGLGGSGTVGAKGGRFREY